MGIIGPLNTARPLATLALASLALAVVTACHGPAKDAGADAAMFSDDHGLLTVPAASPLRSHLTVQPASAGDDARSPELPAAVEADPARVTNILAPLAGRVVALKVALGQHVKAGQALASLASGDFAQATADDDKARDALDLAGRALERARGVQAAGGSAAKDLEAAQSAYAQARAEMTRARDRLAALNGANAGHSRALVLTAPRDGVVTSLAISAGAQVSDPTATLMTVTSLDRVYVTANLAEADIGVAAVGTRALITLVAEPGRTLQGRVTEVDAVVQADSRRQKVRIALANGDGRLMPGMYATVRLVSPPEGRVAEARAAAERPAAVQVPLTALLMNNDRTSVFVEVRPWVFQRRVVTLGDETGAAATILAGLQAGDRVVVRGGVLLND